MKRIVAILLFVILISLSIVASADEFVLRNEILFGDSIEQVKGKEGLTLDKENDDKTQLTYSGEVASYTGEVDYYFNGTTGGLSDMLYEFKDWKNNSSIDSIYSSLKDGVARKYGNPLGNSGGTTHSITGKAFEESIGMIYVTLNFFNKKADIADYDEWFVECDGGAVKIDLVKYYFTNSENGKEYHVLLSYHFSSTEEIETLIQEKQDKKDAIDNDL